MSRPSDFVQGTLDALILSVVAAAPVHGLAISQCIRAKSADILQASHGSLYPALHKLEHNGLLRPEWRRSEGGKRPTDYSLTNAVHKRLRHQQKDLNPPSTPLSPPLTHP